MLTKRLKRSCVHATKFTSVLLLAGCSNWTIEIGNRTITPVGVVAGDNPATRPAPPPVPLDANAASLVEVGGVFLPIAFETTQPYLTIYTRANRVLGTTQDNLCDNELFKSVLRKKSQQAAITLTGTNATLAGGAPAAIPLVAINTNSDPIECSTEHRNAYALSRSVIPPGWNGEVPVQVLNNISSQERLSSWFNAAKALGVAIAPQGSAAVAALTSIAESPLTTTLSTEANRLLSKRTGDGFSLMNIERDLDTTTNRDVKFPVLLQAYDFWGSRSGAKLEAANIELAVRWHRSVLAEVNPRTRRLEFPESTDISQDVLVFNGASATSTPLSALIESKARGARDIVLTLSPDSSPANLAACEQVRSALTMLNGLDRAAALWLIFRASPLGRSTDPKKDQCVRPGELLALTQMGLKPLPTISVQPSTPQR